MIILIPPKINLSIPYILINNGLNPHTSYQGQIKNIVTNYYTELFKLQSPGNNDIQRITDHMSPLVTGDINDLLGRPFSNEKVHRALFDLSPTKAPGPDGFTALFFQDAWDVVCNKLISEALGVLNNGAPLEEWNSTIIPLIPKVKAPNNMKDFRPISLCNVSYKVVVRAIKNRFKAVLGNIIDPYQSAFIPGRAITDNILIGF